MTHLCCWHRIQGDHLSGNPGMSGNLTAVREMSGILLKSGNCQGKNLVREKLSKTVYLYICVHSWLCWVCAFHFGFCHMLHSYPTTDNNTSTGIIWVTLNMGRSATNCQGISHRLDWRVVASSCMFLSWLTSCSNVLHVHLPCCFVNFIKQWVVQNTRLFFRPRKQFSFWSPMHFCHWFRPTIRANSWTVFISVMCPTVLLVPYNI